MVTFYIIAASLFMTIIEVLNIRRQKLKKEVWVFSVFMLIAVSLSIAQANGVHLPSPLAGIKNVYKPLSEIVDKWLG